MSTIVTDFAVGLAIFILGVAFTIRKFGGKDYPVLIICSVLTPVLALVAVISLVYSALRGRPIMDPCPEGLEEAERIVETQRQRMFGGPSREPYIAASWKRAYQLRLQKETRQVQSVARRYFVPSL